jgi:hypothetical protein
MSTINDGGPAFPELDTGETHDNRDGGKFTSFRSVGGMSLRDYFAAKAMQGLLANPGGPIQCNSRSGWGYCNTTADLLVSDVYALADAMLAARAEQGESA